jgi:thiosulfate dehydrogenase
LLCLALACACEPVPAADVGAQLFGDPRFSTSDTNAFACSTCHRVGNVDGDDRILPGADLRGVVSRQAWFGRQASTLLTAVQDCQVFFMRDAPLAVDEARGVALYEHLAREDQAASTDDKREVPFSIVESVTSLPAGNAVAGERLWGQACASCHGDAFTGATRITADASIVPGDSASFATESGFPIDVVIVEKVRHGPFFGIGGSMPPFSTEVLSDAQLGDIVAYVLR